MPPAVAGGAVAAGAAAGAGTAAAAAGTAAAAGGAAAAGAGAAGAATAGGALATGALTVAPATGLGLAGGAQLIGGLATAGAGLATIFGGPPPGTKIELPPELEEAQLELFSNFLDEAQGQIDQSKDLIPFLKERADTLDTLAQQATPDPATIKSLQDQDAEIAKRFGVEIQKDVQAGIITDEAKNQAAELQKQIASELTAQGKLVDDTMLQDIQSAIRNRLDPNSPESSAINEVRNALLDQVRKEGDVLNRDPRVEAELEKSKNQLISDLANRGIDPNSTAGRRALQEFGQSATETRFTTSEQLSTNRIARLSQATQSVLSTTDAADAARSRALDQAIGVQTLASTRLNRIQQLGQTIQAPVNAVLAANEVEARRRSENLQRSQVALGASAQAQQAFQGALGTQANLLQLQQLPLDVQSRILETQGAGLNQFQKIGAQKISGNTQQLLREGAIQGFKPRTQPNRRVNLPAPGFDRVGTPNTQNFRVGPGGQLFLD